MQNSVAERPSVPFGLSLAGLIISAGAAVVVGMAGLGGFGTFGYGNMMGGYYGGRGMMNSYGPWGMSGWAGLTWIWIPMVVASIAMGALGVYIINSSRVDSVRLGSVLVLIAAVLAFPTAFGFVVGSLLMVAGGVLGLIWSPTQQTKL